MNMLLAKGIAGNDFMKQLQKVIYAVMTILKSISNRQDITRTKHTHIHNYYLKSNGVESKTLHVIAVKKQYKRQHKSGGIRY